jgi:hypothetical protein
MIQESLAARLRADLAGRVGSCWVPVVSAPVRPVPEGESWARPGGFGRVEETAQSSPRFVLVVRCSVYLAVSVRAVYLLIRVCVLVILLSAGRGVPRRLHRRERSRRWHRR